jgi:hypothetical protein
MKWNQAIMKPGRNTDFLTTKNTNHTKKARMDCHERTQDHERGENFYADFAG